MTSAASPANSLRIKTGMLDMTSPTWSVDLTRLNPPVSTYDPPERDKVECKINYLKHRTCILRKSN